jgi:hypothetical protein
MLEDYSTRIRIVVPIAAGLILLAAVAGAFAANNTGTRPVSSNNGNPFGTNPDAGRGVGAEGIPAGGGGGNSTASPPPTPRRHGPHPHP